MKMKINFEIGESLDYYILEADTIEELRELNVQESEKRGLCLEKNNMWSEKIR